MVYTCRTRPPRLLRPLPPSNRYSMCHIVPEHRHFGMLSTRQAQDSLQARKIWSDLAGFDWVVLGVSLLCGRAEVFNRDHLLCGISAR